MAVHLRGETTRPLTSRQLAILALIREGWQSKEIARELNASPDTIKNTLRIIYLKLGVTDRTSAVITAIRQGLLPLDGNS